MSEHDEDIPDDCIWDEDDDLTPEVFAYECISCNGTQRHPGMCSQCGFCEVDPMEF